MRPWLIIAIILLAGCSIIAKPSYELTFRVQETGKAIDGNIFLNGRFLGHTENGWLGVSLDNMSEGTLSFSGYFEGRPFNYSYSISTDNLNVRKLSFSVEKSQLDRFAMTFIVKETNETLDGKVINNDNDLGRTVGGVMDLPKNDIESGRVLIRGSYAGKPFEFRFSLTDDDLDNARMSFVVSKDDLASAIYDASSVNRARIEQEVLRLVNVQRDKVGTPKLKWNTNAAQVAYAHSLDMATRGYFAHQSPEGDNVGERLKKFLVFYTVAAEDLSLFENIRPETNISSQAVNGWMNSPGHRAPILDSDYLFSDAGAGVACVEKSCYVTLVFVGNERAVEPSLPPQYLSFYYLYDPNFGFSMPVPLRFTLHSSEPVTVFVVSSRSQYDDLLKGTSTAYLERFRDVEDVDEQITASPNMGLVLENRGETEAKITLKIDYYP